MKYAFIAGSESGLAKAAMRVLEEDNWYLFCSDLVYKEVEEKEMRMNIPMNAASSESIRACCDLVKERTDRLDLSVSFMGIVTLGSLVELDMDAVERICEINFLSVTKINNLLFPLLQKAGGRYITITSEYGHLDALPIHGYYGIAKHALAMYNDSLRRELQKSGVKVVEISPGAFRTNMQGGIEKQFDRLIGETDMYESILTKMRFLMTGELKKAKDPALFAETFRRAAFSARPKRRYRVNNSFKMKLLSALPPSWQDFIYRIFL